MEPEDTNCADELDFDPCMLQSFSIFRSYGHTALDGFTIHVQRSFFPSILLQLHVDHSPLISVL